MSLPVVGGPIHTLRDSYPPAIPLEKYAASLPPECITPEMGRYLSQTAGESKVKSTKPTSPDSTVKLDSNRNILPAPQPVNISPQVVHNPVMTRTANGEIAVVLPQHLLKQAGSNSSGLVVPIYTLPESPETAKATPMPIIINMPLQQSPNSAFSQTQSTASSAASSAASSVTSSPPPSCHLQAPVSPVWRPW